MASYQLIASETTVQVLTPKLTLDVEYVTIQTAPSGVIASLAVPAAEFTAGTAAPLLQDYATNIETIMAMPHVIAGIGAQTLDANGLVQDNVVFTVEYVPGGATAASVTAEATVPTGLLSEGGDPTIENLLIHEAEAIVTAAYTSLVKMAG